MKKKKIKNKISPRDQRLKRLYGLEPGEYEKILIYQGGICAICGAIPKENKNLHVDHDHKKGLTRGILCWRCNTALQKWRDDPILLKNGAYYLENPPTTKALGKQVFGVTGRITNKRRKKKRSKHGA